MKLSLLTYLLGKDMELAELLDVCRSTRIEGIDDGLARLWNRRNLLGAKPVHCIAGLDSASWCKARASRILGAHGD